MAALHYLSVDLTVAAVNDDELLAARERLADLEDAMARERARVAFHEAGHAVATFFFGGRVRLVSIRPGKTYRGIAVYGRRREQLTLPKLGHLNIPALWPTRTRRALERLAVVALAGPEAELRLLEFLPNYLPSSGYAPADHVLAAQLLDAPLTAGETALLSETETKTENSKRDVEVAQDAVRLFASESLKIAQLEFCRSMARSLVFSDRFDRVALPLIEELLKHETVGGERVHEIFAEHDDPAWTTE